MEGIIYTKSEEIIALYLERSNKKKKKKLGLVRVQRMRRKE